jgi:hypothetical protein
MTTNDARPKWFRGQTIEIEIADRLIQDLCGARRAASNSIGQRRTARDESMPRRPVDALDRAKLGGIHDAFDFVGDVPEDLRPLSREGTGARCRPALPGNPDDIRVNHQTRIRCEGKTPGLAARRDPIAVARTAGG